MQKILQLKKKKIQWQKEVLKIFLYSMKPTIVSIVKYVLLQDMIFLCMKTGLLQKELGMPWYLYNALEKHPVPTIDFTLSNMSRNSEYFPSSRFLLHLEMTETKEIKRSGSWLSWHFSGVSCCTHATMTHFLKLHWDWKHFQTSAWTLEY